NRLAPGELSRSSERSPAPKALYITWAIAVELGHQAARHNVELGGSTVTSQ
ncbi:MAG: hypothetical protein HN730_01555, partial [Bdellovibrionales bacterium]|nr:hypothetical protein [Bdellovibrionales bacterium]